MSKGFFYFRGGPVEYKIYYKMIRTTLLIFQNHLSIYVRQINIWIGTNLLYNKAPYGGKEESNNSYTPSTLFYYNLPLRGKSIIVKMYCTGRLFKDESVILGADLNEGPQPGDFSLSTKTGPIEKEKIQKALLDRKKFPLSKRPRMLTVPVAFAGSVAFWIWAAGLFDACGLILVSEKGAPLLIMEFMAVGREIVHALIQFLGVGYPSLEDFQIPQSRVIFNISDLSDIVYFLNGVLPYLKSESILIFLRQHVDILPGLDLIPISPNQNPILTGPWLSGFVDGGAIIDLLVNHTTSDQLKGSVVPRFNLVRITADKVDIVELIRSALLGTAKIKSQGGFINWTTISMLSSYILFNYFVEHPLRSHQYICFRGAWSIAVENMYYKNVYNEIDFARSKYLYNITYQYYFLTIQNRRWTPGLGLDPAQIKVEQVKPSSQDFIKQLLNNIETWTKRGKDQDFSLVLDKNKPSKMSNKLNNLGKSASAPNKKAEVIASVNGVKV